MARQESVRTPGEGEVILDRPWSVSRERWAAADVIVYAAIVALGTLQFALALKTDDFFTGDTTYFELARSIVEKGRFEFDFRPETTFPPGFPAILAVLCVTVGCSHGVLIRSMAVFVTLGWVASYQLLRREGGRGVAAVTCLLVASSPLVFRFSTQAVLSDPPYVFTTMVTLLVAARLDAARSMQARVTLGLLCTIMLVSSVMIRSSGIALITGLAGWLAAGCLWADRRTGRRRLKIFTGTLLVALVVQGAWMGWAAKREVLEWPMVGGYPQSYVSQLRVKSGNQPELGTASLKDIPTRVARNLAERAGGLMKLVTHKDYIDSAWFSPLILGPVLLIAVGLGCSLWPEGGSLAAWYFVSHEAVYLMWPWDLEMRFLVPVAPLACLYLWRGGAVLGQLAVRMPRRVGVAGVLVGVAAGVLAGVGGWGSDAVQPKVAAIFWAVLVAASAWIIFTSSCRLPEVFKRRVSRSAMAVSLWGKRLSLLQIIGGAAVAGLVAMGVALQTGVGLGNLSFDVTKYPSYRDIIAARWIHDHTASTAVVMARRMDVVHHYSRRKVVWFPPVSKPQLLMDGIRRHTVDFVIVTRSTFYWLPPDEDCFEPLLKRDPKSFRLVHEGRGFRIFEVVGDGLPRKIGHLLSLETGRERFG